MSRELTDSIVVVLLILAVFAIVALGARELGQVIAQSLVLPQP